jgi:hypothetical protein
VPIHDDEHALVGKSNHGGQVVSLGNASAEVVALGKFQGWNIDDHVLLVDAVEVLGRVRNALVELGDVASVLYQTPVVFLPLETWRRNCRLDTRVGSVVLLKSGSTSAVDEIWTLGPASHVEVTLLVTHRGIQNGRTGKSVCPSERNTPAVGIHPCLDGELSIQGYLKYRYLRCLKDHAHQE